MRPKKNMNAKEDMADSQGSRRLQREMGFEQASQEATAFSVSGRGITIHGRNKDTYGKEQTNPNEMVRHP